MVVRICRTRLPPRPAFVQVRAREAAAPARSPRGRRRRPPVGAGSTIGSRRSATSRPARRPPDDGCGHRGDRRPHDPRRRAVARRLRLLQLPRLRPRPRDHRRGPGVPRAVGHAPELVAAARQPRPVRADRGAPDGAARLRGLAGAADDHAHPQLGDPRAGGLRHDLPRRARTQDDLRRLPGRALARRRRAPLPLRGPRPPRRAARAPSATARGWCAWTASTA